MKILFLTDNYPPEVNAPANRTYEHCKYWAGQGFDITVITCAPNFPDGILHPGFKNKFYQISKEDGIRIIRVWSYMAPNKGFFRRILDYLSYAMMSFLVGLFIKSDIIIATSPQLFTTVGAAWLAFFKRKPWIMEVRDLWPESIKAVGAMTGEERIYKFLEKVVLGLYRSALGIVVVTDAFKRDIVSKGINPAKIEVVTNGVDRSIFYPIPKNQELLQQLKLTGKFVVGYIGTHGLAHKLDFILECAKDVSNDRVHFLFIGSGAEKNKLLDQKDRLELSNVTFLDPIPRDIINQYISLTDVALVPLRKSVTFRTVIPSKIFENAAMDKPILLGVEGESKKIIETYQAGLCFEPENKDDFINKLNQLAQNPLIYADCITGCRKLASAYGRNQLAERMIQFVDRMYSGTKKVKSDKKPSIIQP